MAEGFFKQLAPSEAPEWQASSAGQGEQGELNYSDKIKRFPLHTPIPDTIF